MALLERDVTVRARGLLPLSIKAATTKLLLRVARVDAKSHCLWSGRWQSPFLSLSVLRFALLRLTDPALKSLSQTNKQTHTHFWEGGFCGIEKALANPKKGRLCGRHRRDSVSAIGREIDQNQKATGDKNRFAEPSGEVVGSSSSRCGCSVLYVITKPASPAKNKTLEEGC